MYIMRKLLTITFIIFLSLNYNVATGQTDIDLLEGFTKIRGMVLEKDSNGLSYSLQSFLKDKRQIVALIKKVDSNNEYAIVDTIVIDELKEYEFVLFGVCQNNGKNDSRIIAVLKGDPRNTEIYYFDKVLKAWKANVETNKIEALDSMTNIKCNNMGHGL